MDVRENKIEEEIKKFKLNPKFEGEFFKGLEKKLENRANRYGSSMNGEWVNLAVEILPDRKIIVYKNPEGFVHPSTGVYKKSSLNPEGFVPVLSDKYQKGSSFKFSDKYELDTYPERLRCTYSSYNIGISESQDYQDYMHGLWEFMLGSKMSEKIKNMN